MSEENPSRRSVLRASTAYGVGAATGLSVIGQATGVSVPDQGPRADDPTQLFRLIDSGFERRSTTVRIRQRSTGETVNEFSLETVGTNNPAVRDLSHEARFPKIAADIESFGRLAPGRYTLEVVSGDLRDSTEFTAGTGPLLPTKTLNARILPDEQLKVNSRNVDDPL